MRRSASGLGFAFVAAALLDFGCRLPPRYAAPADTISDVLRDSGLSSESTSGDVSVDPALRAKLFADVDDYLRAEDPGPSPSLLAKLDGEYRTLPASLFVEAVRWRPQPAHFPALGVQQANWSGEPPATSGVYHAYVPPGLASSTADRYPLVLFLHGASGEGGSVVTSASMQQAAARLGAMLVAPTSASTCDWSAAEECMAQVVLILRAIKRRFPVDDSRVVLTGFSMGGRGAFSVGVAYPDAYCGVVPVAGTVGAVYNTSDLSAHKTYCCPHMENLQNLRLHYISGALDVPLLLYQNRACELCLKEFGNEYVYTELAGQGHVFPPELWEQAVSWALSKPRSRYPSRLVFNIAPQLSDELPGYFWTQQSLRSPPYWVEVLARVDATKSARVEARRQGNEIRLKSKNVAKLRLRLAPEMMQVPGAPIRVVRDEDSSLLWQGTLEPDRRFLLEEARRWSERDAVYLGRVDLSL